MAATRDPKIVAVSTDAAPAPSGAFSQAIRAGDFVFTAGQVPRLTDGTRLNDQPFDVQVRQTMANLLAVIEAAGGTLADAVKVNVYLLDETNLSAFDAIYRDYVSDPPPARTTTQSRLPGPAVEIDAVLYLPAT
jgi:reactive intermediate/imine deaminase